MHPPEFWWAKARDRRGPPLLEWALSPLSWAYAGAVAHRLRTTVAVRLPAPVISIGAATLGGAGKTPLARAVRALLARQGCAAAVVSRGYGGRVKGPAQVDPDRHTAAEVGDEPLLHARDGPTWIGRDRVAAAKAALLGGAEAIVLDDAHQNPSLAKDLSILAFDGDNALGNGRVFPAGPLREPLSRALARAEVVVRLHGAPAPRGAPGLVLQAGLAATSPAPSGPLLAFAGIAFPERFLETLRAAGGDVRDLAPFPDHHPYAERELADLARLAERHGAQLITTEKDYVRLPPEWRARVRVLPVTLSFQDEAALAARLELALRPWR